MNVDAMTLTLLILIIITALILANLVMGQAARNLMYLVALLILAKTIFFIYRVTKL